MLDKLVILYNIKLTLQRSRLVQADSVWGKHSDFRSVVWLCDLP